MSNAVPAYAGRGMSCSLSAEILTKVQGKSPMLCPA